MTDPTRPMNVVVRQRSDAEAKYRIRAGATMTAGLAPGLHPSPRQDLVYHGGKTLPVLHYKNFYLGGATAWSASDVRNIDRALDAAMCDRGLNNVLAQYFRSMPQTHFGGSSIVRGPARAHYSDGDVRQLLEHMYDEGEFDALDIPITIVNYLLPKGARLNDSAELGVRAAKYRLRHAGNVDTEASDSRHGLAGFHGSHRHRRHTLYYAVAVYSEHTAGGPNGIPAFDQPWKNVVATCYHELTEARTDPDVDNPNPDVRYGWLSRHGEEIGDHPIFEEKRDSQIFKEIQLSAGGGSVPVQFMYSNRVHGPEGPRARRYPFHRAR